MLKLVASTVLMLALSGVAAAGGDKPCGLQCPTPPSVKAPEINATSAAAALTLLLGGLVVLRGRRTGR